MNILIKGFFIYIAVAVAMRLMGKRQIGELQPGELVVTILLSEIATLPLQNEDMPLLTGIALLFMVVSLEILSSFLAMKFRFYRTALQGHSILIIKNGNILKDNLKLIRYSTDDLLEALRLKNVFDISQVNYAYIETNGSVSVKLKKKHTPLTPEDINVSLAEEELPCLVISDGRVIDREFSLCGMTNEKLQKLLKKKGVEVSDIFLMTADRQGRTNIVTKDKSR